MNIHGFIRGIVLILTYFSALYSDDTLRNIRNNGSEAMTVHTRVKDRTHMTVAVHVNIGALRIDE